ncbi:Asp23/Gls24 family envelope stress response protein [Brevibacillus dissolubilis]|uniref:Asp23/Gls24 family envelope stress response protein n=1 Tax=Brevibacillus dissolubilis TaxID=1844116 RepID=UPI0011177178|nr:Asp23/Gls24 family envelope stress response protein [Brevibacillus dissolubilis]
MEKTRGEVFVADHVVAVFAGMAALEIEGLALGNGGLYEDLSKRFGAGGKNLTKGILVSLGEDGAVIEMRVQVRYGARIHQLCLELQDKVKENVETFTGLIVREVNVRVEGIETAV